MSLVTAPPGSAPADHFAGAGEVEVAGAGTISVARAKDPSQAGLLFPVTQFGLDCHHAYRSSSSALLS